MLTIVTPAQSYDLTVLATVRAELGITDHAEDENLLNWIRQASDVVSKYCNRVFAKETVAEIFRLNTRPGGLLLERYPISSIVSVTENGETLAITDYEFLPKSGVITRLQNDIPICWPTGKIVVTYTAGYALLNELPFGIERAAILLVNQYRYAAERDPQLRSEQTEGAGSSSYFDGLEVGGLSPEVRGLLAEHRKPAGS